MSTCKRGAAGGIVSEKACGGLCLLALLCLAFPAGLCAQSQQGQQRQQTLQSQQPTQGWIPIDGASGAASSIQAPVMPSVPAVSTPSIGGGFYVPGSKDFYMPSAAAVSNRQGGAASGGQGSNASAGSTTGSSVASVSAGNVTENGVAGSGTAGGSVTGGRTAYSSGTAGIPSAAAATGSGIAAPVSPVLPSSSTATSLQSLSLAAGSQSANQLSSILSAGDLNSLQNSGLIGSFSSLLGANNAKLGGLAGSSVSTDSVMLQQILAELSAIKQEVAAQRTASGGTAIPGTTGAGGGTGAGGLAGASGAGQPRILRFLVNGYDVLPSCKQLYFSSQESDGSFLMTGDRKYNADGKIRSETFYLLFRATGSKSGTTSYNVAPSLSQDYTNENSFLYQVSQRQQLTASRTGNLVTMHVSDGGWNCDLLITLDK